MKKLLLLLTLITFTFQSCSGSDDDSVEETVASPYEGSWSGTFTGDDTGTWTIIIAADNSTTSRTFSNNANATVLGTGSVTASGKVKGISGNGATTNGQITGTTVSGFWANTAQNIGGEFSGQKE